MLFANQDKSVVSELSAYRGRLTLEGESFTECLEALRYTEGIKEDQEAGTVAGIEAVPTVFINKGLLREAMSLPTNM